jgi:polar amino acid transport system substrate-binding protein
MFGIDRLMRSTLTGSAVVLMATSMLFVTSVQAETTLEKIREQGYIRVGFANETPFSYATPEGTLAGIDIEVLQHILDQMGLEEIAGGLTTFSGLIPGLQAKRFGLVTSAIYIKPDRCKQVAFAEPMYILGDAIIVPAGNPKNIHSYSDVAADKSIKIGYPTGGTGVSDNAKAVGVRDEQLIGFPDGPTGFAAVKAGRIDGYATTSLVGETQLRELKDPGLERAEPFSQPMEDGKPRYGIASFAVRLEDKDLLEELNKHLMAFRGSDEYVAILEKYGMSRADLPKDETTASICKG